MVYILNHHKNKQRKLKTKVLASYQTSGDPLFSISYFWQPHLNNEYLKNVCAKGLSFKKHN